MCVYVCVCVCQAHKDRYELTKELQKLRYKNKKLRDTDKLHRKLLARHATFSAVGEIAKKQSTVRSSGTDAEKSTRGDSPDQASSPVASRQAQAQSVMKMMAVRGGSPVRPMRNMQRPRSASASVKRGRRCIAQEQLYKERQRQQSLHLQQESAGAAADRVSMQRQSVSPTKQQHPRTPRKQQQQQFQQALFQMESTTSEKAADTLECQQRPQSAPAAPRGDRDHKLQLTAAGEDYPTSTPRQHSNLAHYWQLRSPYTSPSGPKRAQTSRPSSGKRSGSRRVGPASPDTRSAWLAGRRELPQTAYTSDIGLPFSGAGSHGTDHAMAGGMMLFGDPDIKERKPSGQQLQVYATEKLSDFWNTNASHEGLRRLRERGSCSPLSSGSKSARSIRSTKSGKSVRERAISIRELEQRMVRLTPTKDRQRSGGESMGDEQKTSMEGALPKEASPDVSSGSANTSTVVDPMQSTAGQYSARQGSQQIVAQPHGWNNLILFNSKNTRGHTRRKRSTGRKTGWSKPTGLSREKNRSRYQKDSPAKKNRTNSRKPSSKHKDKDNLVLSDSLDGTSCPLGTSRDLDDKTNG